MLECNNETLSYCQKILNSRRINMHMPYVNFIIIGAIPLGVFMLYAYVGFDELWSNMTHPGNVPFKIFTILLAFLDILAMSYIFTKLIRFGLRRFRLIDKDKRVLLERNILAAQLLGQPEFFGDMPLKDVKHIWHEDLKVHLIKITCATQAGDRVFYARPKYDSEKRYRFITVTAHLDFIDKIVSIL